MTWATANPFRDLDQLHQEINRLFNGFSEDWNRPFSRFSFLPGLSARSYPRLNLREEADHLTVQALAPGVDPDSLQVSVVQNQLVIEGQKPTGAPDGVKAEDYHRNERAGGQFVRTLRLPVEINADKVTAEYRDGLLTITLPKAETARPRQISVNVG